MSVSRDVIESAKQENHGAAQDAVLDTAADWGFELPDIQKAYKGPLHIWNGDEDRLVPLHLQECIQKQVKNTEFQVHRIF
jgi:pimeloyl-ACP methyl ester carboxylesterase